MPPFQGFAIFECGSQGVALGWLICAPLMLVPESLQRRAMLQPFDAGEVEVRPVNVRLQHAADLIRMRSRRADDVDGNVIAKDRQRVRVRLFEGRAGKADERRLQPHLRRCKGSGLRA